LAKVIFPIHSYSATWRGNREHFDTSTRERAKQAQCFAGNREHFDTRACFAV